MGAVPAGRAQQRVMIMYFQARPDDRAFMRIAAFVERQAKRKERPHSASDATQRKSSTCKSRPGSSHRKSRSLTQACGPSSQVETNSGHFAAAEYSGPTGMNRHSTFESRLIIRFTLACQQGSDSMLTNLPTRLANQARTASAAPLQANVCVHGQVHC